MDTTQASPQNQQASVRGLNNVLDALLAKGMITNEQYNEIKFESVNTIKNPEELLKEKGIVDSSSLARLNAEMRNIAFIDISNIVIPVETLNLIPPNVASDTLAIAFENLPHKVKVGMVDPLDLQKIKYIESVVGKAVEAYYAAADDLQNIIHTRYGAQVGGEVNRALEEVGDSIDLNAQISATESEGSAPIIRIVNMILDYGVKNGASDIHIEPRDAKIAVRFRIRGLLTEKLTLPKKLINAVVTRIKILSNLKIDEHRIPQDGRFQVNDAGARTDVRVSIMPSVYGEKVVMRLLEKSRGIMALEQIGISGVSYKRLTDGLKRTQGVILVTGPTGSGKSQTLASSLKILNQPDVNIVTLEDPVELKIDGVNQVQVNSEVGLTFSSGLRAILRQDPDVVMVGEIRDSETATLAIQAALVGRLVLSTIHTNSAAGAFVRLIDMGIEPFLLSSTVNVVMGQRLVRTLCECKEPFEATADMVSKLHEELDHLNGINIYSEEKELLQQFNADTQKVTLYKAVGCPKCNNTGYDGRTGIFEAIKMSDPIASMVTQKKSIKDIHEQAVSEGMITMAQDGFIKALQGITTFEEILRVRNE